MSEPATRMLPDGSSQHENQITLVSAIIVLCAIVYVCYVTLLLRIVLQLFVSRYDDQQRIPPTLRGYYLQWKTKSRKVPGTKSESSRVKSSQAEPSRAEPFSGNKAYVVTEV